MYLKYITYICLFFATLPLTAQPLRVKFEKGSWPEIIQKAQREGKFIFVDAFANFCMPCKMMEKAVFVNREVAMFYNKHFINYKLNMDDVKDVDLKEKHDIVDLPTLLFFNSDGQLLRKEVGGQGSQAFLTMGEEVVQKVSGLFAHQAATPPQTAPALVYTEKYELAKQVAEIVVNPTEAPDIFQPMTIPKKPLPSDYNPNVNTRHNTPSISQPTITTNKSDLYIQKKPDNYTLENTQNNQYQPEPSTQPELAQNTYQEPSYHEPPAPSIRSTPIFSPPPNTQQPDITSENKANDAPIQNSPIINRQPNRNNGIMTAVNTYQKQSNEPSDLQIVIAKVPDEPTDIEGLVAPATETPSIQAESDMQMVADNSFAIEMTDKISNEGNIYQQFMQFKNDYVNGHRQDAFLRDYAYLLKKYYNPYNVVVNEYLETVAQNKSQYHEMNRQFIYDFAVNLENQAIDFFLADIDYYKQQYASKIVNKRIKDAVRQTVLVAAEERNYALFEKAERVIQEANIPFSDAFIFEIRTTFYEGVADWDSYAQITIDYVDAFRVSDPDLLNDIAWTFHQYVVDRKMLKVALAWVEKSIDIESEYYNNHTYAALLYKLGHESKAINACHRAIEIARKRSMEEANFAPTLRLLDVIEGIRR